MKTEEKFTIFVERRNTIIPKSIDHFISKYKKI